MKSLSITKLAFRVIQGRLDTSGFKQYKQLGVFWCPLSDEVLGWLGLNRATHGQSDYVQINPVVGVRNQRIERLVAELTGDPYDEVIPPTISKPIGYLMPSRRFTVFTFAKASSVNDETARDLCDAVNLYGLPFMKSSVDLRALVEKMEAGHVGLPFQMDYRIPVGRWLLGDIEKASTFLKTRVSEMESKTDPASLRYKGFAAKLIERLDHF